MKEIFSRSEDILYSFETIEGHETNDAGLEMWLGSRELD